MIRTVKYLVLAVLALVSIVALVAAFVPAESFRAPIETAVRNAADRPFTIGGPVRFVFSRGLGIELQDVAFGDKGEGALVRAKRAVLDVEMLPLLSGRIKVTALTLEGAEIHLTRDASGRGSWAADEADAAMKAVAPGPDDLLADLGFGDVRLTDSLLLWRGDSGELQTLPIEDIRLRWPHEADTMTVNGTIRIAGEAVEVETLLEQPRSALLNDRLQLRVAFQSALATGAFDGDADLKTATLSGGLTLTTSSARRLAGLLGVTLPGDRGLGRMSIAAAAILSPGRAVFQDAKLSMDAMAGSGDLTIALDAGRLSVEGSLAVDAFDTYAYVAPQEPDDVNEDPAGWSDAAIDLSGLSAFDAQIKFRVRRGAFGGLRFENAQADLLVRDGQASLEIANANLYGGTARGRVGAANDNGVPRLEVNITLSSLDGQSLLLDAAELDTVTGRAELTLDLSASGATRRARMATLGGSARLQFTAGSLDGVDLEELTKSGGRVAEDEGGGATNFASLAAVMRVSAGIATVEQLTIDMRDMTLSGAGSLDLARRDMALTFTSSTPAGDQAAGFSAIGSWASPVFAPLPVQDAAAPSP